MFEVIGKLCQAIDTINVISSTFIVKEKNNQMVRAQYVLYATLNNTKQVLWSMMNESDNFLGTILKEQAYQKHMEMREFVYKSYGTVIMSVLPAVEKVTHNFQIVCDSHCKQIINVLNPKMVDLSKLIQAKAFLISNDMHTKSIVTQNTKFQSACGHLENSFKEIASRVNLLFGTK